MPDALEDTTHATPSPHVPEVTPTVLNPVEARQLLEQLSSLITRLSDGSIRVQDGAAPTPHAKAATPRLTVKEQRAREIASLFHSDAIGDESLRELRSNPEPRRQRKERQLAPRRVYSLKPIKTAATLHEVRNLTPAASAVVVFLATRPKTTVPELSASLDLRRKTVENALSMLQQKGLVSSEPRR